MGLPGHGRIGAGRRIVARVAGAFGEVLPGGRIVKAGVKLGQEAFASRHAGGGLHGKGGKFYSVGKRGVVGYIDKHGRQRTMRVGSVAHIGKNLPKHRMIVRLRRNLKRHVDDAVTILRLAAPHKLGMRRKGGAPRWHRRRYGTAKATHRG